MCGKKKSKIEHNTDPYLVINDHPAGRLLQKTTGTDEIEGGGIGTNDCLSSQMQYESKIKPDIGPHLVMDPYLDLLAQRR